MGCSGSKNNNQGIILSCEPKLNGHQMNNVEDRGTEVTEDCGSSDEGEHDDSGEALPENESFIAVNEFGSENDSFYSAEDCALEKEELTLQDTEILIPK
ncbi:hypothetical protein L6164_034189 [Bauhinia variegata]|uniref:Uncharacterized protein n=1 Tax=Bauhinia variegata TaxID=167791 RepID=A0ACB9KU56_BAUVA|nr:hypothetical protein L6164_034189 [Bauhinia variegata]